MVDELASSFGWTPNWLFDALSYRFELGTSFATPLPGVVSGVVPRIGLLEGGSLLGPLGIGRSGLGRGDLGLSAAAWEEASSSSAISAKRQRVIVIGAMM